MDFELKTLNRARLCTEKCDALVVLVPQDMKDAPIAAEVIAWTRERLANYKLPKRVLILSELPRNTMGKVLKATLREWVVQGEMADEPKIQP